MPKYVVVEFLLSTQTYHAIKCINIQITNMINVHAMSHTMMCELFKVWMVKNESDKIHCPAIVHFNAFHNQILVQEGCNISIYWYAYCLITSL